MDNDNLTPKQRAFVDAYCGEANFVGQTAAKMAGYSERGASQQGTMLLRNPKVRAEIKSRLDDLQDQGMRIRVQRIQALERLLLKLRQVQLDRATKAEERHSYGEDIPLEALTGLMIEVTKTVGTGSNRTVETSWELDKTLIQEQQRLIDQISKESGDRVADKLQIDTTVSVESAKSKLLALTKEDQWTNQTRTHCQH
jgi:phage terminase small subunit